MDQKTLAFSLMENAGKLCVVPDKAQPKQLVANVKAAIAQLTIARQILNDVAKTMK